MEGGVYPRGGSGEIAKMLIATIERNSPVNRVLIRANVRSLLSNEGDEKINGVEVKVRDKFVSIFCKKGVISSAGYHNTMKYLVPKQIASKYYPDDSLKEFEKLKQSAGFVMATIGIDASNVEIDAVNSNTWNIPVDMSGDLFGPMEEYFRDPLSQSWRKTPAFITFPSLKDQSYKFESTGQIPATTTCQMLLMADYEWFENFKGSSASEREAGYLRMKELWKQRCLEIFLHYFPKAAGHVAVCDISTPLTIENYLNGERHLISSIFYCFLLITILFHCMHRISWRSRGS